MIYPTQVEEFQLGKWGAVKFTQWLHPHEHRKEFTERDIDWLAQFIRPGDTAIDIGAFTADTALPMAVAAGKTGTVHAFEPNPASLEVLLQNSKLNEHIAPIHVVPYAIGVRKENAIFNYHCEQINGGFLTEGKPVTVKRIRLDECDIAGRVSFVKIDTEGEDGTLLAEYSHWLKNRRCVVQVERYPYLDHDQEHMLWQTITSYGVPSLKDDWNFIELKELPSTLVDIIILPHPHDNNKSFDSEG